MMSKKTAELTELGEKVQEELRRIGVDLGEICAEGADASKLRVVCIAPDLMKSGSSSAISPVDGLIFASMDSMVHATCAVWAWKTGV